jgi:hypothetical protein
MAEMGQLATARSPGWRPLFLDEATFAGTRGNGQDAPIPAVRAPVIEPQESAQRDAPHQFAV